MNGRVGGKLAGCLVGMSMLSVIGAAEAQSPTTQGHVNDNDPANWEIVSVDDDLRFIPTTRPQQPVAQHPPIATTQNSDTGKPPQLWQRFTDDWNGLRPRLDDKGIAVAASLAGYVGTNLIGGAQTDAGGCAYLLNLNLTLDSKKLVGLEGGSMFVNLRNQDGLSHSMDGSFGATSSLYIPGRTEVSECWFEQKFLNDQVRIKAGKIDVNTEFDTVENGGEFLNDFGALNSTILAFPTDPDSSIGVNAFVYPNEHFYAGAGIYDGSLQDGVNTGSVGPHSLWNSRSAFWIGEIGDKWDGKASGREGRVALGVWHHTGSFEQFDGGHRNSVTGPYIALDQCLWRKYPEKDGDKQGIAMFFSAGYASPHISSATVQAGGGLKWTGAIAGREDDVLGLGASCIRLSHDTSAGLSDHSEFTIETFYKIRINPWFSIEPDLQYIHNPDGVSSRDDALMATIQMLIDF
ncbi:MAG TPA: carbohydrate porin [Tepidisphaeraceae bacterium]|nr:carbohydrate porin [Tepidisphaeraceae bacterium]